MTVKTLYDSENSLWQWKLFMTVKILYDSEMTVKTLYDSEMTVKTLYDSENSLSDMGRITLESNALN